MSAKAILLSGAIVAGFLAPAVAADQIYAMRGFSKIEADNGVEINVIVGGAFSVEAAAKRGNIDRLQISQQGNRLMITRETSGILSIGKRDRFVVDISLPQLDILEVSSGVAAEIDYVDTSTAAIVATSGAELEARGLKAGVLEITSSSGASMDIEGSCTTLEIAASSGASLDARGLKCHDVQASGRSGASLRIFADGTLTGEARSGASVSVYGDPEVTDFDKRTGASLRQR